MAGKHSHSGLALHFQLMGAGFTCSLLTLLLNGTEPDLETVSDHAKLFTFDAPLGTGVAYTSGFDNPPSTYLYPPHIGTPGYPNHSTEATGSSGTFPMGPVYQPGIDLGGLDHISDANSPTPDPHEVFFTPSPSTNTHAVSPEPAVVSYPVSTSAPSSPASLSISMPKHVKDLYKLIDNDVAPKLWPNDTSSPPHYCIKKNNERAYESSSACMKCKQAEKGVNKKGSKKAKIEVGDMQLNEFEEMAEGKDNAWTDEQGAKLLKYLCDADRWTTFCANQAQGFCRATVHMGGVKAAPAICSWFDHELGHFKYIKTLKNHTGGGNGDDIGQELDGIEKEGSDDKHKCSTTVIAHFKEMGWYALFENCCGSKPDIKKSTNLKSGVQGKKHPHIGNKDLDDADDEASHAEDSLPHGKCCCHAACSTGQDIVDEKMDMSRCQVELTEDIGTAFTNIANTYAMSFKSQDTRANCKLDIKQHEQGLQMMNSANPEIVKMGLSILRKLQQ
ncbi:hypothetical protein BS47DRAFT_1358574 [Hydnum rufescens UP504]|uniref:Uncharacterized protein n=1 Tax=Hydnum rufescens UP504 TaxID=1448309 RepID=A0A9P6B735_9AGAM|nr:hypothetical protein BS47DRAFT_1358574 [Hydnum rufescens UP504]